MPYRGAELRQWRVVRQQYSSAACEGKTRGPSGRRINARAPLTMRTRPSPSRLPQD
jgi:hypothetical protein